MTSSPHTPFVVPPTDDGDLVDDGVDRRDADAPLDSADADRAASYGDDVPDVDQDVEAAQDGVEADRRAAMPQTD